MSLQLGQTAPDFTAESSQDTIHFHDWAKGKWTEIGDKLFGKG